MIASTMKSEFSGRDRLSWPTSWQMPHLHCLIDGGGTVLSSSTCGVPYLLCPGLGADDNGQTESMSSAEQKGSIWSYKYHCCSALNPCGGTTAGRSSISSVHGAFSKSCFTSGESHCSLVITHRGEAESILKWCIFLMPMIFFILGAKSQPSQMCKQWYFHVLMTPTECGYILPTCWLLQ